MDGKRLPHPLGADDERRLTKYRSARARLEAAKPSFEAPDNKT